MKRGERHVLFFVLFFFVLTVLFLFRVATAQTSGQRRASSRQNSTQYPLNASGNFLSTYLGTPSFYWDFSQDSSGATVVVNSGQTLTKAGTPTRVSDWTWPNGLSGSSGYSYRHDGSNDYWSSSITVADLVGATGKISGICAFFPTSCPSTGIIIGNHQPSNSKGGWAVYNSVDNIRLVVTKDGTTGVGKYTSIAIANACLANRDNIVGWSYDPTTGCGTPPCDGSSTMKLWVDNLTEASSTVAVAPIYASAMALSVSATGGGAYKSSVIDHVCVIWPTTMTQTEFRFLRDTFRGVMGNRGSAVTTTWATPGSLQLAPASSGVEPFIIDQPANSSTVGAIATGSGGLAAVPAVTNLLYRSKICETEAGGGHPSGWVISESAGNGSASVDCDTTTYVDGVKSIKYVMTGTTSAAYVQSNCMTTGIGGDLYLSNWIKKTAGTSESAYYIAQYDAADCTTLLTATGVFDTNGTSTWTKYGVKIAAASWNASTSSYKFIMGETCDNGCTVYRDAPMLYAGSEDVAYFCGSDADATTACSAMANTVSQPLRAGEWTVAGRFISLAASPASHRYLYNSTATSGNNNNIASYFELGSNNKYAYAYDGAGNLRLYTINQVITANTEYAFKHTHNMLDQSWSIGSWNGSASGSTGAMGGIGASFYLGSASSSGNEFNGWVRDIKFEWRANP